MKSVSPNGFTVPTLVVVRTTTQSIATSSDTAVSWSSALKNTGPSSWWSSGAATQIVMPWAGLYQVSFCVTWASNATGSRAAHLNRTTTISAANLRMGDARSSNVNLEDGRTVNCSQILYEATAGTAYVLAAFQSSGGNLNIDDMQASNGYPGKAFASFVYLGNDA